MVRTLALLLVGTLAPLVPADDKSFTLNARTRTETATGSGRYHTTTKPAMWDAAKTAVVICDMWDKHWCDGATGRVGEMAPRMNELIVTARTRGALVIHCPSDTMAFYKDTPGRKLAMSAPKSEPKVPLERWCKLDPAKEVKLPIDDSDGGCETPSKKGPPWPWTRQHAALKVEAGDAITDSDEAYHLMRQRGIENVVVMGVHTNMCVLGRPFAIRQLTKQGLNVVLVRDMTDTMYNPAKAPFVSHFTGTDLVVEHVEKHWCPTVTSVDFLGGQEFRFKDDTRPSLVIVTAEDEYKTEQTLPDFALKHLGKDYRVSFVFADAKDKYHLPGLDQLATADGVLLSVRRKPLTGDDLGKVKAFVASGRPVVAIRTSSHAFAPRKGEPLPAGVQAWEAFDTDILGCEYKGHYPNTQKTVVDYTPPKNKAHPILGDWPAGKTAFASWMYKSNPLAKDVTPLLTGTAGNSPPEPIAWVREAGEGHGHVFYTCLGHPDDFKQEAFVKLLKNGVAWAAGK